MMHACGHLQACTPWLCCKCWPGLVLAWLRLAGLGPRIIFDVCQSMYPIDSYVSNFHNLRIRHNWIHRHTSKCMFGDTLAYIGMGYIGIHRFIGYIGIHRSQRKVIGRLKPFHIEHSDPRVSMYPDVSRCIHRCIPMYLVKKVSKNMKLHSLILMYADVSRTNTLAYIGGYIVLYLAILFHYLFDEMASTYFKCVIGIHRHTSVRDSCYWLKICKNTSGYIGIHLDTSTDVSVQFPPVGLRLVIMACTHQHTHLGMVQVVVRAKA
jgi:hypothetical protein